MPCRAVTCRASRPPRLCVSCLYHSRVLLVFYISSATIPHRAGPDAPRAGRPLLVRGAGRPSLVGRRWSCSLVVLAGRAGRPSLVRRLISSTSPSRGLAAARPGPTDGGARVCRPLPSLPVIQRAAWLQRRRGRSGVTPESAGPQWCPGDTLQAGLGPGHDHDPEGSHRSHSVRTHMEIYRSAPWTLVEVQQVGNVKTSL